MTLSVALGTDHGGFSLKTELLPWLQGQGYNVLDMGAYALDPDDDYPDCSELVAQAVTSGEAQRGILVCGSGVGVCIVANKVPGVRACLCHDIYSARQGVEHDDMNVLCLGALIIRVELAKELLTAFLSAQFSSKERYHRRLQKVLAIESKSIIGKRDRTG